MPAAIYEKGAKLVVSKVPVKPGAYARVKSCNYLQNVMTKKESVDRGADFALNVTGDGFVAEGPTENILVLKKNGELLAPPFDYTLRGTTLLRVLQIAESLQGELCVTRVGTGPMTLDDLREAREIMMVGTTLGACPVTWLEGVPVSDGQVGPIAKRLHAEVMKLI
jgi:branched-chain amino acid aminotransferase